MQGPAIRRDSSCLALSWFYTGPMSDISFPGITKERTLRYDDVVRRIEEQIRSGKLPNGTRLSGERDMAREMGVGRVTIRRALGLLRDKALIRLDGTRGWIVDQALVTERNALRSFTEFAALRRARAHARVLRQGIREATLSEIEVFGLAVGDRVMDLVRLRMMDDEPTALEESRVPLDLCPELALADFSTASLHALLRSAGIGPVRADYDLTAVAANEDQAALLQITVGAPLLAAEAIARDQTGRVVECSSSLFRADRYRFHTTLKSGSDVG
ncbi:MAG: hypothetical protein B7Z31_00380 [Rhodobacterales bacterium 12-65-15]|nr:MAG: hypothetical protein B7Z31_00380 [Rhodobacterales bacterium 12-65-15]